MEEQGETCTEREAAHGVNAVCEGYGVRMETPMAKDGPDRWAV